MKKLTQLQLDQQYDQEAALLKKVKEWLEAQPDILLMRVCDRYHKGYSDIFLCIDGKFCAIELKDNTGTPSQHQKLFIADVKKCRGVAGIAQTLREVVDLVNETRSK